MNSTLWALVASVIGGFIGASIKFLFDNILAPRQSDQRQTRQLVRRYTTPLLRSAVAVEARVHNLIQSTGTGEFDDDYYRLSTLFVVGEHFGWIRIIERRFGFVPVEAMKDGRDFTVRMNGVFRSLTSFGYFKDLGPTYQEIAAASVPRFMLTAIGEAMTAEDGGETTIEFTVFARRYVNDRQFALWFGALERFLDAASAGDPLCVDRLVICGAELRALVNFLDPEHHVAAAGTIRDLERVTTPGLGGRVVQRVAAGPSSRSLVTPWHSQTRKGTR